MAGIIFSEGSGVNESIYGACQAPVRMFVENYTEECEKNSALKYLFKMGTSENYGDLLTEMTGMDGFDPVGENGAYPEDDMQEGNQKLLVYQTWKDSFAISEEMVEDSKLMDLTAKPRQFVTAYNRTREKFGAALFAGAISGQNTVTYRGKKFDVTGADKLPVFHRAHKPIKKGATQANLFSNAFSLDALDRMEAAMHLFKGENDEILDVSPDTILIPEYATLKREVFAAVGSDQDAVSNTHAFNFQYGRWNIVMWPYLNQFLAQGLRPWIMLDSQFNENYGGAVWNDRVKLKVKSIIDESTDANRWKGRSRFNACFNNWRFAACGGMEGGVDLATLDL